MIVVTRLNDSRFAVNPDLIERIHETPDTTLIMVDGAKYIVTEPMAEVIEMIARYRARIVAIAYDEPHAAEGLVAHLMYAGLSSPYRVGGPKDNEPE